MSMGQQNCQTMKRHRYIFSLKRHLKETGLRWFQVWFYEERGINQ